MSEETLETLAIKEKKNALSHGRIKTYSAAITMLALAASTITAGFDYLGDFIKERKAARAKTNQQFLLQLTDDATKHIDSFLKIDTTLTSMQIAHEQITPAILLRGLDKPGAIIINNIIKKSETEEIAQILGHSYSNIALSHEDPFNYLIMNADSIDMDWKYTRNELQTITPREKSQKVKDFRMQLVAFQFIAPPIIKRDEDKNAENLLEIREMFVSIAKDIDNPKICGVASKECATIKDHTKRCLEIFNMSTGESS